MTRSGQNRILENRIVVVPREGTTRAQKGIVFGVYVVYECLDVEVKTERGLKILR